MLRAGVAAVLMLVTPGVLHAEPRPPQLRGSGGLGIFAEAEEHFLATVGWRKYVGARGWGFEIEGLAMRGDDHQEAAFAVDVVKDLAPPDSGTVPYLNLAGLHLRRQQPWVDDEQRGAGVGLGCRPRPGARVRDHRVVRRPAVLHRAGSLRRLLPEHPALGGRGVYAVTR